MAHTLRRRFLQNPLPSSTRCIQCLCKPAARHFTTSPALLATSKDIDPKMATQTQMRAQMEAARQEKSAKLQKRDQILKRIPNDLGLLAGTLVMPTGPSLPSLFGSPLQRLRLERQRLWKRIKDFISILVVYKWIAKPRLTINFRQMGDEAKLLHRQMYTAFADCDTHKLHQLCCKGLAAKLRSRIDTRILNLETAVWTLHDEPQARVVSHRATKFPIPGVDDSDGINVIRQAVVRISSRQSLARFRSGELIEGTGAEKDVVEYLVIQKRCLSGKEEPWMVWGTVEETKMEDLEEALHPVLPET